MIFLRQEIFLRFSQEALRMSTQLSKDSNVVLTTNKYLYFAVDITEQSGVAGRYQICYQ